MNETFGLAIGAWRVGASEALSNTELKAETAEDAGAIAGAVIGEHARDGNPQTGVVVDGGLEESGGRAGFLVGQDLREGDARMIIDGDMHILPAGTMNAAAAVAGDTTTDRLDATDLFDVEVEQIARCGMFITQNGRGGLQIADAAEMKAAQNAAHGGATESGVLNRKFKFLNFIFLEINEIKNSNL